MDKQPPRLQQILIIVIVVNALVTGYLLKTVWDQQKRIETLERNDAIQQRVNQLNGKIDDLKSRIQGLFK